MSEREDLGSPQRFCRNCGKELRPGDDFCVSCGERIDSGSEDSDGTSPSNRSGWDNRSSPEGSESHAPGHDLVKWSKREIVGGGVDPEASSKGSNAEEQDSDYQRGNRTGTGWSGDIPPFAASTQDERAAPGRTLSLTPKEALNSATEYMVAYFDSRLFVWTRTSFTIAHSSENSVTFRNYLPARWGVVIGLALLFSLFNIDTPNQLQPLVLIVTLLPAVIYAVGGGRYAYSTLTAFPLQGGCEVTVSGESEKGSERLQVWIMNMPKYEPSGERGETSAAETKSETEEDTI